MKTETIGLVMGQRIGFSEPVGIGLGLCFVHTKRLDSGELEVTTQMRDLTTELGFEPLVTVMADPRNWLLGYELYLVEGLNLNPAEKSALTKLSQLLMDEEMQKWKEVAKAKAES